MSVVFVINPDTAVSKSLASVIHAAGWQPEIFADPRDFMRHPRAEVPACLVFDAELPDICGLDLQTLFVDSPEMPVIFTAKCPVPRAVVLAMKARAVDFLPEPPDEDLLLSVIRAALDRSRAALARGIELCALSARYASLVGLIDMAARLGVDSIRVPVSSLSRHGYCCYRADTPTGSAKRGSS